MKVNVKKLLQKVWAHLQKFNVFSVKGAHINSVNNYQFIHEENDRQLIQEKNTASEPKKKRFSVIRKEAEQQLCLNNKHYLSKLFIVVSNKIIYNLKS